MMYGGVLAAGCQMPCCKAKMPMPNCPMIRTVAPKDLLANSAPIFEAGLQPLYSLALIIEAPVRSWATSLTDLTTTFEMLFTGPAKSVRAPPSDVHLLAA